MEEFDSAMPNMLGNELTAIVASMYYYASSSSVLMSQLLPFLPQTASTLCLLSMATSSAPLFQSPTLVESMEDKISAVPPTTGVPSLFDLHSLNRI
jgi:hypothetical protein